MVEDPAYHTGQFVVGCGCLYVLLAVVRNEFVSDEEIWAVNMAAKLIDDYIIIPAAIGLLITGLVYSVFTKWGFFKFNWITVKYIIAVISSLFGAFFLGPWVNGMEAMSKLQGLAILQNEVYLRYALLISYFGLLQFLLITVMVVISVLKPWKRGKNKKGVQAGTQPRPTSATSLTFPPCDAAHEGKTRRGIHGLRGDAPDEDILNYDDVDDPEPFAWPP